MDHFTYKDGHMFAEDVPLSEIAENVGTPFYAYSTATLTRHYNVFADALKGLNALVCFAVKANSNQAVIKTLANLGAGADVVSGGELTRALKAGIPANKIVFSGVGKTDDEIRLALNSKIKQINVESEPELDRINEVATDLGVVANVTLRVNPDVDAKTHEKISTGKLENKFGIEWTRVNGVYLRAHNMTGVKIRGLSMHIGSQLLDLQPFKEAYTRAAEMVMELRNAGMTVDVLDIGGGLGIPYFEDDETAAPTPNAYAQVVRETLSNVGVELVLEPGRMIAGNSGILVTRVIYVKEGTTRTFLIADAGMNDLIRPTLYSAFHKIVPEKEPAQDAELIDVDVVGPICETGDTFAKGRKMAKVKADDLLVMRTAGAYGAVQANTYNTRSLIPEVMINGDNYAVVRERVCVDDIIAMDRVPGWLND